MNALIGQRKPKLLLRALRRPYYYRAFVSGFAIYQNPIDSFKRYLTASGEYPTKIRLRTPIGPVSPTLYSWHDMLTVNEIFCRGDYRTGPDARVIVDFGSNIGLSALYFLTRNPSSRVYLFEPVPENIARLNTNLHGFEERFSLEPLAVALNDGECTFGTEPSGRYGGIGVAAASSITVRCRLANDILAGVLAEHGSIDVLKIDVEGLEKEIFEAIPPTIRRNVKCIFMEANYKGRNPYPAQYAYKQQGSVAQFRLLERDAR